MWIEQISLEGYGPYADTRTVEFADRAVSLVLGPNEMGKSTLVSGLCAVLFGERPSVILRMRSWNTAENGRFRGTVRLRTRDGRTLRLTRDFDSETLSVTEIRDNEEKHLFSGRVTPGTRRGSVVQPYESLLTEILGFSSRTIFEQTLCVHQTMLSTVFASELREIASGSARADYVDVRTRLLERCDRITQDRPPKSGQRRLKNQRELEQALGKHRRLCGEIEKTETWMKETAEIEAERDRISERLEAARQTRDAQREQIKVAEQYLQTLDSFIAARDEHSEELQQLRSLHETLRNAESVDREIDRQYGEFRNVADDFLIALGEIEALQQQVEESVARVTRLTERLQEQRLRRQWSALAWFGSGGLVLAIGLALLLTDASAAMFCGVLAVGGCACICGAAVLWWTSRNVAEVRARRDASIEQRHSVDTRCRLLLDTYKHIVADRSPDAVRARYREYREKLNEHTRLVAQAQVSVSEDTLKSRVAELDAGHAAARTQLDEIRRQHSWVARWKDNRDAVESFLEEARNSARETDREIDTLRNQAAEAEKKLAVKVATSTGDLEQLRDERDSVEREIAGLQRERDALYMAWHVLDESIEEYSRTALERVAERASQLFETFTAGRYTRVHLNDRLEPHVENAVRTDITPEDLSTGACDQLYLALRIAFAETLAGREALPLILDDPFANFDSGRLQNALHTLDLIAKERQVILLTHDQRVEGVGKVVARLDSAQQRSAK